MKGSFVALTPAIVEEKGSILRF